MKRPETQIELARRDVVTPEMKSVSEREGRSAEYIRNIVAEGRAVIPANHAHTSLEPIGIGSDLLTKINANIGNSATSSGLCEELRKLAAAVELGADTVMDLSTGEDIDRIRIGILSHSTVPIGTVPIYEAATRVEDTDDLDAEILLDIISKQARQGVDYMTLHVGLLRRHLPLAERRLLGVVSRGGAILAKWMKANDAENPLFERFDDILSIFRQHDVTISLGDGLRPGCLADASDEAQFAELDVMGELVLRCRAAGVQAMVEGPGHVPLDQIQMNMERENEVCDGAPFYILGPVVTDCAPGYDHISSAIGAAVGAMHGAAMLCYVTPKEHLGLPNARDVREGVVAYKIAAHAADIARRKPGARDRDDAISRARARFDWEGQFDLALDPGRARELRAEAISEQSTQAPPAHGQGNEEFCTMCGPKFCSMRLFQEAKGHAGAKN